jgi:hypothetical protein
MARQSAELDPKKHIVITVHGIRTLGKWQERLADMLRENGSSVYAYPYKYGFFSVLAFVVPPLRFLRVRQFRKDVMTLIAANRDCEISIVGHSFGTHMIGEALANKFSAPPDTIKQVILSGSVLKSNFDWQRLIQQRVVRRVVNDCGIDDRVLLLSQFFVLLTGMAGRIGFFGFTGPNFVNRFFRGGHSHYFLDGTGEASDGFMRQYWLPLLVGSEHPKAVDERSDVNVMSGAKQWLIQNADAPKVAVLSAIFLLGWQSFWVYPRQQAQIRVDLARDKWVISTLADGTFAAESPTGFITDEDRIGGMKQNEFEIAIQKLSRMDGLSKLEIRGGGHVENINSLYKLNNLRQLVFSGAENLKNMDGIESLKKLEHLEFFRAPKITNIKSISNLTNLKTLILSGFTNIYSIAPISNLKNMEKLELYEFVNVNNIEYISKLSKIENLVISKMDNISSIYPLTKMKKIKHIDFSFAGKLNNINGICNIKTLEYIDMRDNDAILNLEPLRSCNNLTSLDISLNDGIIDISPLSSLDRLKYLYMRQTENIKTLRPLKGKAIEIEDASNEQMATFRNLKLR